MALVVNSSPANAGDGRVTGSIPRLGRFPLEGRGNPFPYSCLENPMDSVALWATVPGVQRISMTGVT